MVEKVDVFELIKVLPRVTHSDSSKNDPTVSTLIILDRDTIKERITDYVMILLQEYPEIMCSFIVEYSPEQKFRAGIQFQSGEPYPNLKYKASLYSYFSEYICGLYCHTTCREKLDFSEDLNLENITRQSTFYFSRPIDHPFLLFQISRIGEKLNPMQIETPKSEISKDLSLLLKNKLFTDVKIICQDQEFPAHKLLLMARSSVFQAMFDHKMKESQENKIEITDFEPEIVEHLLKFIYTDTVENLKEEQAEKLLAAADKYALENLKLICIKEISKSVKNVREAFDVLAIAEHYNVPGSRDIILEFAEKNSKQS